MKRAIFLAIITALCAATAPAPVQAEEAKCGLGDGEMARYACAQVNDLVFYAKFPRGPEVHALIKKTRSVISGAKQVGLPNTVIYEMMMPWYMANALRAHADDLAQIIENTYTPTAEMFSEALVAIEEAEDAGIDCSESRRKLSHAILPPKEHFKLY